MDATLYTFAYIIGLVLVNFILTTFILISAKLSKRLDSFYDDNFKIFDYLMPDTDAKLKYMTALHFISGIFAFIVLFLTAHYFIRAIKYYHLRYIMKKGKK